MKKYQEDGVFSIYFEHQNEGSTLSNQPEELSHFFMSYLHIKDQKTFFKVFEELDIYLEQLEHTIDLKHVFSHQNVNKNIYLLQKKY